MAEVGEDFPQLCETCLGPNAYVRMLKLPPGQKLCKISGLAFQAFRWKPAGGRQKETIVSFTVAKERNICQTCLNDMQYGLPVGVRDKLLADMGAVNGALVAPHSQAGAAYHYKQIEEGTSSNIASHANNSSTMVTQDFAAQAAQAATERQLAVFAEARAAIEKRSSTAFRNLPKLCSFWIAGTCTRCVKGLCAFRPCAGPSSFAFPEIARTHKDLHKALVERLKAEGATEVMKTLDAVTRKAIQDARKGYNQDDAIKERVQGTDELSGQYLDLFKKKEERGPLVAPADHTITTLWLGNVEADMTEAELRHALFPGGPFNGMHVVPKSRCCFVEYATRTSAEEAARILLNNISVRGQDITVNWAKPKTKAPAGAGSSNVSGGTTGKRKSSGDDKHEAKKVKA